MTRTNFLLLEVIRTLKTKTQPWEHQIKALKFFTSHNIGALFTKPGSGKTKIMIDVIVNRCFTRTLVVAPKKPAESVWENEIFIHSDFTADNIFNLTNKKIPERIKIIESQRDSTQPVIFICNYEVMHNKALLDAFEKLQLDCIICDESHRIKAPNGKISKALFKLGKNVPCRYIMSGTPFSDKPTDIYAQFRFLDAQILGTSYQRFFEKYTNIDPVFSARIGHPILDKKAPYKNQEELSKIVNAYSFTMEPILELPNERKHFVDFPIPENVQHVYKTFAKEGFYKIKNSEFVFVADNALSKKTMEQRFINGFAYGENPKGQKKLFKLHDARQKALYSVLDNFPARLKIVVFYKYSTDKKAIFSVCKKLGRTFGEISGKTNNIAEWQDDSIQVLAVQYAAGAEGLSLVESSICIFYSLPYSLSQYQQAVARQRRPGQLSTVDYIFLIAKIQGMQTVDEEILTCLKNKKSYIDEIRLNER